MKPPFAPPVARTKEFNDLVALVGDLYTGPWRLIQLRGLPINAADIDRGDVDFLATRESVNTLMEIAFRWVQAGKCHLWIKARDNNKTSLALMSLDGRHVLSLDLWVRLWQLPLHKSYLRFEDCESLVGVPAMSIQRLPVPIEASIYVNHLIAKKKVLSDRQVQERLAEYSNACAAVGESEASEALKLIAARERFDLISTKVMNAFLFRAKLLPGTAQKPRWMEKMTSETVAARLSAPRQMRHCTIMGCDGSGKTTLTRELVGRDPNTYSGYTGKHLYRKSLLYKFLVVLVRPLLLQGRESFDDMLAPWNYIRASAALELQVWCWPRGVRLIDRSIVDFLMVKRKTDVPRLHSASWLTSWVGRRIPSVHLVVPNSLLRTRKAEMTTLGQQEYDAVMFKHFAQQVPTNYAVFYNGRDLRYSRRAMGGLLNTISRG